MRRALRIIFRRGQIADAVDDEIAFHLDMRAKRLETLGMSPEAARREALRQFGNLDTVRRACVTFDEERERTMRRRNYLDALRQDTAYALRTLRRNAGFTLVIVLTLALGIGANTAIFTLVNALLLRPLDVSHPEQLVAIGDPARPTSMAQGGARLDLASYPVYQEVRARASMFSGILASGRADRVDVSIDGHDIEHPRARFVSGNYFAVLGVPAAIGRTFGSDEDDGIGTSPVLVISHDYWQRRFAGSRDVIGKKILIDGVPMSIIGVARPGYQGEVVGAANDLWLPLTMQPVLMPSERYLDDWSTSWLLLLGRLKPHATLEEARAAVVPIERQAIEAHASSFPGIPAGSVIADAREQQPHVESGRGGFSRLRFTFGVPLLTLMAGVGLLLLIVCANVANLLLARAIARGREVGVRLALGAGRGRLVRQLMTENLILGLTGAAGGLLFAHWGSQLLVKLAASTARAGLDLSLDWPVLGFTLLLSVAAVLLFGLAPALRAARVDLATSMRANTRGVSGGLGSGAHRRLSAAKLLIVGQVVLSLVLLAGAALLVRSLRSLEDRPTGLDREHLLIVSLDVGSRGYTLARRNEIAEELSARLAALPGVVGASYSENGIFSGTESQTYIGIPGFVARTSNDTSVRYDQVGPHYAEAIGARVAQGRDLTAQDDQHVAFVNESFAREFFPDGSAVGRWFRKDTTTVRIVGVVGDVVDHDLRDVARPRFYESYLHPDGTPTTLRFELRTTGDPARLAPEARRVVAAADPQLPIDDISSLSALMRDSVRQERLLANVATGFGLAALLLAALGLYGVMTYAVTRRTGEIGLRVALGAQRSGVIALIVRDALFVVLVGFAIGVPVALGILRYLGSLLHGVGAADPASLAVSLGVLLVSALLAVLLPALRASRVSPIVALREE
jgi:putative ABC transport system permease protein